MKSSSPQKCKICNRSDWHPFRFNGNDYVSRDVFHFHACKACGSFTTLLPESTSISDYYGEKYYRNENGKFIPGVNQLFLYQHKRAAKKIYQRWKSPKIVVDIGCGQGVLMNRLSQLGASTFGVEHDDAASWVLENPEVRIETHSAFFATTGKEISGKVDLVIFWHVLEHLEAPLDSLLEAYHLLKTKGLICISVPNINSLQARLSYKHWFHLDVPRHLYHFTPDSLNQLLEQAGFTVIRKEPGDWYQNLFGWFQSLANIFSGVWSGKCDNSMYRIMQNQKPDNFRDTISLLIQILTAPVWLIAGLLGYLLSGLSKNPGTMTIYAEKNG